MTVRIRTFGWVLLGVLYAVGARADAPGLGGEGWADVLRLEVEREGVFPLLGELVPDFDLALAYDIQRAMVNHELPRRRIGGYKGGFTGAAAQARFGLDAPVSAVLFADGALGDGASLSRKDFHALMVEIEIGFILRSPIRRRMKSIDDLRTYVRAAVPAIELPDLRYPGLDALTGLDIVATNMGSRHYLVGDPLPLETFEAANALDVVLYRDGEAIDQGTGGGALGNQLEALLWLVNHLHAAGWPLEAGHLLITGTLGRINPGEPGVYRAAYGENASVTFTVTP